MTEKESRPVGEIAIHDERGYAYFPKLIRREIGIEGKGRVPFYLDANLVLLVRKEATREEILKGLDVLKEDLKLRWRGFSELRCPILPNWMTKKDGSCKRIRCQFRDDPKCVVKRRNRKEVSE